MSSELTVDITGNPLTTTKPLPTVPRSNNAFLFTPTSALTIEAREHLRSFLRHCLDEDTHNIISEVDRDVWTDAFERALTELGQCITRGGWLKGIRRRRTEQKKIHTISQSQEGAISNSDGQDKPEAIKTIASSQRDPGLSGAPGLIAFPTAPSPTPGTSHDAAIEQLRERVSKSLPSTPKLLAKHLLLCLSPLGNHAILSLDPRPLQQLGPSSPNCVFTPGRFTFPGPTPDDARRVLLYGLDEWDVTSSNLKDDALQIVGGTFTFTSINSPLQHNLLTKTLRLSIYVYLSLLLEQSLLSCSGINLEYDKRRPASPTPSIPISAPIMTRGSSAIEVSSRTDTRSPRSIGGGILSFLTKRGDKYFHRTSSSDLPSGSRRGSLDIDRRSPSPKPPLGDDMSALGRLRRFSFITDSKPASVLQQQHASQDEFEADSPYDAALKRIEKYKSLLSTSPGIVLAPPPLLVTLAAKERKDASRRTKGDEKMGLMTLLGWEGKESKGKGMTGTAGFVRQQEITFVHSKYVPQEPSPPPPPASLLSSSSNSPENGPGAVSPSSRELEEKPKLTKCGQARWVTYRYYAFGDHEDETLEDVVVDTCSRVDEPCEEPDCHFKACEHETRWLHGVTRVASRVKKDGQASQPFIDTMQTWESCRLCGKMTSKQDVSDGAALMSFAKFLELLVYSPSIISLTPSLCEHTSIPPQPWQGNDLPLPRSRFNIVRHFSHGTASLSFELTEISEVFELRVPRLQIVRGVPRERAAELLQTISSEEPPRDEKLVLRKEMLNWWHGVAEHIDKLEASFNAAHHDSQRHSMKSLPRLPSMDTPLEEDENDDALKTPRAHDNQAHSFHLPGSDLTDTVRSHLSMTSSSSTATAEISDGGASLHEGNRDSTTSAVTDPSSSTISSSSQPTAQTPSTTGAPADPVMLLSSLRQSFLRTEQVLYSQLARTPVSSLNDVRRAFQSAARGASKRLTAWQSKHLPKTLKSKSVIGKLSVPEPEWWCKTCHPAPGSNVIVREDDWGSIIAYTLSSIEYQKELGQMAGVRQGPMPSLPSTPPPVSRKSFFSGRLFSSSHLPLDPDQEGHVWHEPEAFSAAVTREEHPRDPSGLLSIREVLRQKAPEHVGLSSRFINFGASGSKTTSGGVGGAAAPPSAWAKPAVEVSKQEAAGGLLINGLPDCDDGGPGGAEKILHDMEATSSDVPSFPSRPSSAFGSYGPSTYEAHIRRWKTSSIISADNSLNSQEASVDEQFPHHSAPVPPPLPPKDRQKDDGNKQMQAEKPLPATTDPTLTPTTSGFTASITNSLTNAMRLMLTGGETSRPTSPIPRKHHGLLTVESMGWDEKPHIKHDWMVGKRLKFSCVVYYAKQFDGLRRRCGLEENFLQSLGRSLNWAAQGGKSRSNFWKTADDRYIIKTLVDAWNVADLQVLLDLAPSYFRYMDSTHNRPTVLAKLLGFYTVEIKNLETGSVQTKADLLVMENLFFNQRIAKTFDLKGIAGRKVKAGPTGSNVGSKTLFDGEWIEDQQHTLTLVYPHSKLILREAIKRDCEFLAQSNIMDYSLLLGIDEETKQIACGLVDTIGSYTFAKTLEYKAKQGLSSGKTPTVIPPNEYQERFVNAIESYFLASPDKWTKPEDETKIIDDYKLLPCVL